MDYEAGVTRFPLYFKRFRSLRQQYAGEGFDCPALDTLFLAATPTANKGGLAPHVGRILRSRENEMTAEVHDYLDERTGVLAAMLAKRAPGYTGLKFPDPHKVVLTPSASTDLQPAS